MILIAVWGSSGAGKTTLSLALAAALAQRSKNICVMSLDTRTPALPVYLPNDRALSSQHSLGPILELGHEATNEGVLKDRLRIHPKSDRICFAGLAPGELTGITYRAPERQAIIDLLQILHNTPIDFVIVDCDSSPIYDPLTLLALEQAPVVLRVVTPTVKGYEGMRAQTAWLQNNDLFQLSRHIKVANQVFPHAPMKEAAGLFDGFHFTLPYAARVGERMEAGELLRGFQETAGMQFERTMESITTHALQEVSA